MEEDSDDFNSLLSCFGRIAKGLLLSMLFLPASADADKGTNPVTPWCDANANLE